MPRLTPHIGGLPLALLGALLAAAFVTGPAAAESCAAPRDRVIGNPAFARPQPCARTRPAITGNGVAIDRRNGSTNYRFGNTDVGVSGYVRSDTTINRRYGR
jgi:hypothetical protein